MSEIVDIGPVEPTPEDKLQMATEEACATLIAVAREQRLLPKDLPEVGLMYLPDQKATQQFRDACKAVIDCLKSDVSNG